MLPKITRDLERIDLQMLSTRTFIAGLMKLPVMAATERDGELIADFKTDGSGLRKAQMMRVGRLPPAD